MQPQQVIVILMLLDAAALWSYPYWRRQWLQRQHVRRSARMIWNIQQGRVRILGTAPAAAGATPPAPNGNEERSYTRCASWRRNPEAADLWIRFLKIVSTKISLCA